MYTPANKNQPGFMDGLVTKYPAVVVEATDLYANLSVFTLSETEPVKVIRSVPHSSEITKDSGIGYWDWPEIK